MAHAAPAGLSAINTLENRGKLYRTLALVVVALQATKLLPVDVSVDAWLNVASYVLTGAGAATVIAHTPARAAN